MSLSDNRQNNSSWLHELITTVEMVVAAIKAEPLMKLLYCVDVVLYLDANACVTHTFSIFVFKQLSFVNYSVVLVVWKYNIFQNYAETILLKY